MSHETIGPERSVVYTMPLLPSDALRSMQFDQFFEQYRGAPFSVHTHDGWGWSSTFLRSPVCVVTFRTRQKLDGVINDATESTFGRLFLEGDLDIQGDIAALTAAAEYVLRHSSELSGTLVHTLTRATLELSRRLMPVGRSGTMSGWHPLACASSLPLNFFEQWLGPSLAHSCARFRGTDDRLDTAQSNAMEAICTALGLKREDRLLEVGCGWGTLLLYAASRYKATAQGTTSSIEQAAAISERVHELGLQWNCSADCRDLRARPYPPETFDKIAEVGVFGQSDSSHLREHFACLRLMLVPGGVLLMHRLTRSREPGSHKTSALYPEMFSNGRLAPLSKELETAEAVGLDILSVENLRADYEHTLSEWIQRLQRSANRMGDESHRGYRAWLLYLMDTITALQTGAVQLQQFVLQRPSTNY